MAYNTEKSISFLSLYRSIVEMYLLRISVHVVLHVLRKVSEVNVVCTRKQIGHGHAHGHDLPRIFECVPFAHIVSIAFRQFYQLQIQLWL